MVFQRQRGFRLPPGNRSFSRYRRESVDFKNGAVCLSGTLTLPSGTPPYTAVILIHGSGPQPFDHSVLKWIADYFVFRGAAVLAYDKRGVGRSSGNWKEATIEDLAMDALAGAAYLKSRPEIDPKKIGLWGITLVRLCHSAGQGTVRSQGTIP